MAEPTQIYFHTILEARYLRSRCWQSWFLLKASFLGLYRWLSSSDIFTWSSFCVCVCVLTSSSDKDISHIGLQSTHMTSFYLNPLLKGLISKYSHILRHWEIRTHLSLTKLWSGWFFVFPLFIYLF